MQEYLDGCGGRIRLHFLPARCPEANPMEGVWWGLHEAISRNHGWVELEELLGWAERYLSEREPRRPRLGRVYREWENSASESTGVHLSCAPI